MVGAPHRVLEISELAGAVASQLVLISRKSAANLARLRRTTPRRVVGDATVIGRASGGFPDEAWDYGDPESGESAVCGLSFLPEKSDG